MWFTKSKIALSAAVILALSSECYTTASLFFTLGLIAQMTENEKDKRRRVGEIIDEYEKGQKNETTEED